VEWGIKGQTHVGIVTAVQFNLRFRRSRTGKIVEHEVTIAFFPSAKGRTLRRECASPSSSSVTMGTNRNGRSRPFLPLRKNVVSQCSSSSRTYCSEAVAATQPVCRKLPLRIWTDDWIDRDLFTMTENSMYRNSI